MKCHIFSCFCCCWEHSLRAPRSESDNYFILSSRYTFQIQRSTLKTVTVESEHDKPTEDESEKNQLKFSGFDSKEDRIM